MHDGAATALLSRGGGARLSDEAAWTWYTLGVAVAGLTALSLIASLVSWVMVNGRGEPITLSRALAWEMTVFVSWAAMIPLILAVGRRFPLTGRGWLRHAAIHVLLAVPITLLQITLFAGLDMALGLSPELPRPFLEHLRHLVTSRLFIRMSYYWILLAALQAMDGAASARRRDRREAELRASLERAQFQALTLQVQPHFLFNALHNVIALVSSDDRRAATAVLASLGELLRSTLQHREHPEMPLGRQITELGHYLEIESTRYGDRLRFELAIPRELERAWVPVLLLQPLVENAVRHGVAPCPDGGVVRIGARQRGSWLRLTIENSGSPARCEASRAGLGLGLRITRERLRQLYGERQRLSLRARRGGGTCVAALLPWHELAPPAAAGGDPR